MSKYGKIILRLIFVTIIGGLIVLLVKALCDLWHKVRGA